jgi:hypothetical protein
VAYPVKQPLSNLPSEASLFGIPFFVGVLGLLFESHFHISFTLLKESSLTI